MKLLFTLFVFFSLNGYANDSRIVSLSPALTEILFALDLGSNIVGTSEFSNFPEAAKKIERIGGFQSPNIEKIVSLKPTVVLSFQDGRDNISEALERADVAFKSFKAQRIDDYKPIVTSLGKLFSKEKEAIELVKEWDEGWSAVYQEKKRSRIVIQLDHSPLIVSGGNTFLSEVVERCGHKNAFENAKGFPVVQIESLVFNKPNKVLIVGMLSRQTKVEDVEDFWKRQKFISSKPVWVEADGIARLGPRLPKESKALCEKLL